MKTIGHSGPSGLIAIIIFFLELLHSKTNRKTSAKRHRLSQPSPSTTPHVLASNLEKENREDYERMQKIVDKYKDYSAEVISYFIQGKKRVKTFRLLNPGNKVELRLYDDDIKMFAYGEYIAELLILKESHLKEVMKKGLPFHAFLGGRDSEYRHNEDYDFGSIIVFYKLEGLPPTHVTIEIN